MDLVWGLVESVDDPIKAQRVQVRIYGYYDNLNADELPWCQVLRSATDALTFGNGKSSHELVPGSQVLCCWLDQNYQQPIVLGQVPRVDDCVDQTNINKQVYKTKGGNEVCIDDDEMYVKDKRGNEVRMSKDGITVKVPKSVIPVDKGNINITVEGSATIKATSEVTLEASSINLTSSEATIKSSGKLTIDGGQLSMKNISGMNQFCCLPNCLFTGGKHTSPSTD
jgi:hypothetical protein